MEKLTALESTVLMKMAALDRGEGSISVYWCEGNSAINASAARRLERKGYLKMIYYGNTRYFITEKGCAAIDTLHFQGKPTTTDCQVEVVYEDNSYRHFRGEYSAASARFLVNENKPAAIKWWVMTRFSDGVKLVQQGSW